MQFPGGAQEYLAWTDGKIRVEIEAVKGAFPDDDQVNGAVYVEVGLQKGLFLCDDGCPGQWVFCTQSPIKIINFSHSDMCCSNRNIQLFAVNVQRCQMVFNLGGPYIMRCS